MHEQFKSRLKLFYFCTSQLVSIISRALIVNRLWIFKSGTKSSVVALARCSVNTGVMMFHKSVLRRRKLKQTLHNRSHEIPRWILCVHMSRQASLEFLQLINCLLHWVCCPAMWPWSAACCLPVSPPLCFSLYRQLCVPEKLSISVQLSANKSSDLLPALWLCLSSLSV